MDKLRLLEVENQILRKENDNLIQRITDLENLLIPEFTFPLEWDLPRRQTQVLILLYTARKRLRQEDFVAFFMKHGEAIIDLDCEANTAESHISKLRRTLKKLDIPINIISKRFEGYYIDADSKVYMKQFLKE